MTQTNPLEAFQKFERLVSSANTIEDVNSLFKDFSTPMGVCFFACAAVQGAHSDPERSRMLGYNDIDWMKHYMNNEYYRDDPIFNYGKTARRSFTFEEALDNFGLNERSRLIMLESEKYGLKEGFAVPLRSSDDHLALFSIAGSGFANDSVKRGQLHLAAIWAHDRALTLLDDKFKLENIKITHREFEIVNLAAEGWSDEEIADDLNIEIGTVRKHKHSLRLKTGATTKEQIGAILRGKRIVH